MSTRREQDCGRCNGDAESACECPKCGKCSRRASKISATSSFVKSGDTAKIASKSIESHYVTHIAFAGIRSDNIYEVKLLVAPEIDLSTVKITVKKKNLRVTLHRPLGELAKRLPLSSIHEKSPLNELIKKAIKHCDNFLIPETIDGDKVRAMIDNKNRILVLTAPTIKPCKALRRRFSMDRRDLVARQCARRIFMRSWRLRFQLFNIAAGQALGAIFKSFMNIPRHCLENATFFERHDDMDLRMTSRGLKTAFRFIKVPDFYTIDEKEYFAAEMKLEGLKIGTAALAGENVLNIKLHEIEAAVPTMRNVNFFIPPEADARQVSVEVYNGNAIFIRAPLRNKH